MKNNFPIGTVILFAIAILIVSVIVSVAIRITPKVPQELVGVLQPAPRPIQPFAFKDHTGKLYTLEDLKGTWTFLFFGYTYCPDVCPTTLTMLTSLTRHLETKLGPSTDVQVVFVSIDPQRDKPEVLAKYLRYFHDSFLGITAGEEQTRTFADQFGAMFFKEQGIDAENYLMAHASSIYLISPKVNFVASFAPPHDYNTIASQYLLIRNLYL